MNRIKTAGIVAGLALLAPMGIMDSADASTTSSLCTVTPLRPVFAGFNSSGVKLVDYRITVSCTSGNRNVEIDQHRWEDDPNQSDDHLGDTTFNEYFSSSGSRTLSNVRTLPDTDDAWDNYEEVFQKVHFRVTSNSVTSPWTSWRSARSSPSTSEQHAIAWRAETPWAALHALGRACGFQRGATGRTTT